MWKFLIFFINLVSCRIINLDWSISQQILKPDGVPKLVYTINQQFIPILEADIDDTINLKITNNLYTEALTLHFHGLHMYRNIYQDGVAYITQYPVLPKQSFYYNFNLQQSGTYWFHSHFSNQYTDGLFGALIIHNPADHYDIRSPEPWIQGELIVIINGWYHESLNQQISILRENAYPWNFPPYTNILWNGQGYYNCSVYNNYNLQKDIRSGIYDCQQKEYPRYEIKSGFKPLRLQIINASPGLTLVFSVDSHTLVVIEVDGTPIEHYFTQRIEIYVGQRYSVLIYPLNSEIKTFWIRTNTLDYPIGPVEQSLAILSYDNSESIPTTEAWSLESKTLTNLNMDLVPVSNTYNNAVNLIDLNLRIICSPINITCYINNATYIPDFKPIILQQYYGEKINNPSVISVLYGGYYRVVINNPGSQSHPLHKHLKKFWILGVGKTGDGPYTNQTLNYYNPIPRDSIQINAYSWIVLVFEIDDFGPVTIHCHIQLHTIAGMLSILVPDKGIYAPPLRYMEISEISNLETSGDLKIPVIYHIVISLFSVIIFIQLMGFIYLWRRRYKRYQGIEI